MNNPFSLDGQLALVTGGGTGLGFGISKAIIEAGGRVVITGRREDTLREACGKLGENAGYIRHDVTELHTIPDLVDRVEQEFGPITILVNNAGIHLKKPILDTKDEEFAAVLQTHVNGGFALAREVARKMIPRRSGSIIWITSMSSILAVPDIIAYTAAKSAISGMVRALSADLSPYGITVNSINPGWIESDMLQQALDKDPERKRKILSRTPMGRLGSPSDIGYAAVYLSSPASRFVTGVDLRVDGGAGVGF